MPEPGEAIEIAAAPDGELALADFVDVLEEAGQWLWDRGIPQWEPGSNRAQQARLRELVRSGCLLRATQGDDTLAGCILSPERYEAWEGVAGDAVYLHKLAVRRAAAGTGLGARVVARAEDWAREQGFPVLRLDCWDGNASLRGYYRSLGFRELGTALEHGYTVRLFERP